jgi:hypothetical protein
MTYEDFKEKYPDYVEPTPIDCLNLVMKKEFAEQIINGEKRVEFRPMTEHYVNRLTDDAVNDFINRHNDEEEFQKENVLGNFVQIVRPVKKIHFRNYNNSWYLDVECKSNDAICCVKSVIEWLNETFDCHELDKLCADLDARNEENRPIFYAFELGEILDRHNI